MCLKIVNVTADGLGGWVFPTNVVANPWIFILLEFQAPEVSSQGGPGWFLLEVLMENPS